MCGIAGVINCGNEEIKGMYGNILKDMKEDYRGNIFTED